MFFLIFFFKIKNSDDTRGINLEKLLILSLIIGNELFLNENNNLVSFCWSYIEEYLRLWVVTPAFEDFWTGAFLTLLTFRSREQ